MLEQAKLEMQEEDESAAAHLLNCNDIARLDTLSDVDSAIDNDEQQVVQLELNIQCVSVDSACLIIYPEIKATEVAFSALKRYLCSFYFRIDNETGRIQ